MRPLPACADAQQGLPCRPPAQPVYVPGHNLGHDSLELGQVIRRQLGERRPDAIRLRHSNPFDLCPTRRPTASGRDAPLLGENVLRQVIYGHFHLASLGQSGVRGRLRSEAAIHAGAATGSRDAGPIGELVKRRHDIRRTQDPRALRLYAVVLLVHGETNLL